MDTFHTYDEATSTLYGVLTGKPVKLKSSFSLKGVNDSVHLVSLDTQSGAMITNLKLTMNGNYSESSSHYNYI